MKNVIMNGPINALRISLSNFFIIPAAGILNGNCSNLTFHMKHPPKLTLSDEELQLVNNTGWILTKHDIIQRVYDMFGRLSERYKVVFEKESLPVTVRLSPKISKGENYRRLPYVILDHPRCFDAENIFAVRSMFWWGNFFSITLQLSGEFKKIFEEKLIENSSLLKQEGFYICINEDPWQHHFESDNYLPAAGLGIEVIEKIIRQKQFIKLAAKFPLNCWDEIPQLLEEKFYTIMELLKS